MAAPGLARPPSSNVISCQESVGEASAAEHVSALARQAFDRSQAARRPVACLALSIDYRALLASTHGEPWMRGVESEVFASLELLVGEGEAFLVVTGDGARIWVPGLAAEPSAALATRILVAIRERSFLAPSGLQPITLSLGLACSASAQPPFDPALCFETLQSVAQEGLELAVDCGGDRCAHSELYGLLQAARARHEPQQVAAQEQRVRELMQVAEREAVGRAAQERVTQQRAAQQRATREQAAVEAPRVERRVAPTPDPALPALPALPHDHADSGALESGETLSRELRLLLDALRDGRREPAAVEHRIAELVQARLALERRRVGAEKDQAYGFQVDKLERRLSKLNDALAVTEERWSAGSGPGAETGAASAFRKVQGLSRDEPEYELKRDLMAQIFQANLELARWATGDGT